MNKRRIYVLHLWSETAEDDASSVSWRLTIEEPHSGKRWGFTVPSALVAFVRTALQEHREETRSNDLGGHP